MDIKYPDGREWKRSPLLLSKLSKGEIFRQAGSLDDGATLWMRTDNSSTHPERKMQVRTVSLRTGAINYMAPDKSVVRVIGSFVVEDWGQG